jgi:hypothetical protein
MENGMIVLDSDFGKEIGFTSGKFYEMSYLWLDEDRVIVSVIFSKEERGRKGEFIRSVF